MAYRYVRDGVEFSIERAGRDEYRYSEGARSVLVGGEMLMTGHLISAASIKKWDGAHWWQRISKAERKRIVENLRVALESQGAKVEVDWV